MKIRTIVTWVLTMCVMAVSTQAAIVAAWDLLDLDPVTAPAGWTTWSEAAAVGASSQVGGITLTHTAGDNSTKNSGTVSVIEKGTPLLTANEGVWEDYILVDVNQTFVLSGLTPDQEYQIQFIGHCLMHANGGRNVQVVMDGSTSKTLMVPATSGNLEASYSSYFTFTATAGETDISFVCSKVGPGASSDISGVIVEAVEPPNLSPTITSTPATQTEKDVPYSYTMTATDAEGDPLTYSSVTLPSWLSFDAQTCVLSGTPTDSDNDALYRVTLRVTDGVNTVDHDFSIKVGFVPPNVVMFIVDDMITSQFGCFHGEGKVLTPHVDQLADEGMKFWEAYASSTVCVPSRYSFATGRHACRSEYESYLSGHPTDEQSDVGLTTVGISESEQTIGHLLSSNGYFTGWTGKFHIGCDEDNTYTSPVDGTTVDEEKYIKDLMDDTLDTYNSKNAANQQTYMEGTMTDRFTEVGQIMENHIKNNMGFDWAERIYHGNLDKPLNEHNMEWTIEAVLDFLDTSQTETNETGQVKPFYLHVCTTALHGGANQVTDSMDDRNYCGYGWLDTPIGIPGMRGRNQIKSDVADAGLDPDTAGITWLDAGVGKVMDKLDELGLTDNTMFVFIPDHGIDNKGDLFSRRGCNVPLVIRYPSMMNTAGVNKGVACNELVQNIDMVPTVLDLAGITPPASYKMDGKSIKKYFENPVQNEDVHEYLFFDMGIGRAILKDNMKYLALRLDQARKDQIESHINSYTMNTSTDEFEVMIRDYGLMGTHYGISKRGLQWNPAQLDFDQLYSVGDPGARNHQAEKKEGDVVKNLITYNATKVDSKLQEMKAVLSQELTRINQDSGQTRPFGEFDTGSGPGTMINYTSDQESWRDNIYNYYFNNFNTGAIGELDPAIVTYPANLILEQGESFNYKFDALNYTGGGGELSYECLLKPDWLSYSADTETLSGTATSIGQFGVRLRVSNTTDTSKNSVQYFDIIVEAPPAPDPYETIWTTAKPGVDSNTGLEDDYDNDGRNNLYEYALGGDPENPVSLGLDPIFIKVGSDFQYTHQKRNDDLSLDYDVETTDDLVSGSWVTTGYSVLGTNVLGGAYDEVTNSIPATAAQTYVRLKVTNQ